MTTLRSAILPPIEVPAWVHELPKADLHVHAEASARLDRVLASREGRPCHDWLGERASLMSGTTPGLSRLERLDGRLAVADIEARDAEPENLVGRISDVLEEAAQAGAWSIEVRFSRNTILYPDFMALFREAERRVWQRHPRVCAQAVISLVPNLGREELLDACCLAAREGLAGVDFIPSPYDAEVEWTEIYRWAERASRAGLGITVHAGEFSTANIAAALRVPCLRRISHVVYAARDPHLLELLSRSSLTIEACLTSNVVLGAVDDYEDHPIRQFLDLGIPVTLNSDDPVRLATTIEQEYAVAARLGFSPDDLLGFTRNALHAGFMPAGQRIEMLAALDAWEGGAQDCPYSSNLAGR